MTSIRITNFSHKLLSVSWPRQISLANCGISWIHTQTTINKNFFVYPAMAQQVWQSCRAQPPEISALLFHRQAIITAIRLGRLVNLNLGITLWHQGGEDVLCACTLVMLLWTTQRVKSGGSCSSHNAIPWASPRPKITNTVNRLKQEIYFALFISLFLPRVVKTHYCTLASAAHEPE